MVHNLPRDRFAHPYAPCGHELDETANGPTRHHFTVESANNNRETHSGPRLHPLSPSKPISAPLHYMPPQKPPNVDVHF
jgi:hypothetical protein